MSEWKPITPLAWNLFLGWLSTRDPDSEVGIARCPRRCPLATYLEELNEQPGWVYPYTYGARWRLPAVTIIDDKRLSLFVEILDRAFNRAVTAGECLEIASGKRGARVVWGLA